LQLGVIGPDSVDEVGHGRDGCACMLRRTGRSQVAQRQVSVAVVADDPLQRSAMHVLF